MTKTLTVQDLLFSTKLNNFFNPGEISDGTHTYDELYEHRYVLYCAFTTFASTYYAIPLNTDSAFKCWKSAKHYDGTMYDDSFIAGFSFNGKTGSYHLPLKYWDLCDCEILENAPKFNGHTSNDTLELIKEIILD